MQSWFKTASLIIVAAGAVPSRGASQEAWTPLIERRLRHLTDSAAALGLPARALQNRIQEGRARGVAPDRVHAVLLLQLQLMRRAQLALPGATEDEIEAGASALRVGVPDADVAKVRSIRQSGAGVMALLVMTDLVHRGSSAQEAATAVISVGAGMPDSRITELQHAAADPRRAGTSLRRLVDELSRRPRGSSDCCPPAHASAHIAGMVGPAPRQPTVGLGARATVRTILAAQPITLDARLAAANTRTSWSTLLEWGALSDTLGTVAWGLGLGGMAMRRTAFVDVTPGTDSTQPGQPGVTGGASGRWWMTRGGRLGVKTDLTLYVGGAHLTRSANLGVGTGEPSPFDTLVPSAPRESREASLLASLRGSAALHWGKTSVAMQLATPMARDLPTRFGASLMLTRQVTPGVAVTMEHAVRPAAFVLAGTDPGLARWRVGILLDRSQRTAQIRDADGKGVTVRIECQPGTPGLRLIVAAPRARAVTVMGDVTAWAALSLLRVAPGRFEALVPAEGSLQRLRISVDGGPWMAPPGWPTIPSDFGGTMGAWSGRCEAGPNDQPSSAGPRSRETDAC